jgi:ketoreductase RED2
VEDQKDQTGQPVAVVFGGSSGIGAAVARRFHADGHRVAVVGSRPQERVSELLEQLGDALYVQRDLGQPDAATDVVEQVLSTWGRIDAVVYSAGATVKIPHADVQAVTDEVWERILGMNVVGPWRVVRAAEAALRRSGNGSVTVIGALAGADVGGSSIPYAVSKAAVHHMCKLLGAVMGPEVRVNVVAPGLIDTPWTEGWDELTKVVVGKAPLARVGTPEDIADTVALLVASRYVTGQTLVADGGLSLIP